MKKFFQFYCIVNVSDKNNGRISRTISSMFLKYIRVSGLVNLNYPSWHRLSNNSNEDFHYFPRTSEL